MSDCGTLLVIAKLWKRFLWALRLEQHHHVLILTTTAKRFYATLYTSLLQPAVERSLSFY